MCYLFHYDCILQHRTDCMWSGKHSFTDNKKWQRTYSQSSAHIITFLYQKQHFICNLLSKRNKWWWSFAFSIIYNWFWLYNWILWHKTYEETWVTHQNTKHIIFMCTYINCLSHMTMSWLNVAPINRTRPAISHRDWHPIWQFMLFLLSFLKILK